MRSDDNIWIYWSSIVLIRKLVKQYEYYRILANHNIARDFPSSALYSCSAAYIVRRVHT